MSEDIQYRISDNTLFVEHAPSVLTKKMMDSIRAFNYRKIVLCEGIEEINDKCFINYSALEEIKLPDSLKKIGKEAFRECYELKEIILPNNIQELDELVFYKCVTLRKVMFGDNLKIIGNKCFENCALEHLVMPDSVTYVGNNAFCCCFDLKEVVLSKNLKKLGNKAFYHATILRKVEFYNNLLEIGDGCFELCGFLKSINIPEGVEEIKNRTFFGCDSLCEISFPSGLKKIGVSAFENCRNIKQIPKINALEIIGEAAFYNCYSLERVELGDCVKEINSRAFAHCVCLQSISMPDSVTKLGSEAFYFCHNLQKVILSPNIKIIENGTFVSCRFLSEIYIPEGIVEIKNDAFKECNKGLENITLPKSLNKIGAYAFSECALLKEITIPEGVREIPSGAFSLCTNLESITLPSTVEIFDRRCLSYCENILKAKTIKLNTKYGVKEFDLNNTYMVDNVDYKFMIYDPLFGNYTFYMNGELIEFNKDSFKNKKNVVNMLDDRLIESDYFVRLYYWNKRRFVPGHVVIKNMPLNDIDKFYVNDNGHVWGKLLKDSKLSSDDAVSSFFKLCYVLGVFSESTTIRGNAVDFLNKNIIGVLYDFAIHRKFDGFDLSNGFNEEYAEFFMKYYNNYDFMIFTNEYDNEVDLMAASYNNFKFVKNLYPNRTINTNRKADMLLPVHVMNAVKRNYYYNVDEGNEKLALVVGGYGYSQEQFEKIQSMYNVAKNINSSEMKLFVGKDVEEDGITYELLSKNNPLNVVLGNITNCCQIISGAGESCIEYGMCQPNSGFVTFNYKGKIIGQSWIWYDEDSKTICLDNIEVPHRYCEKISSNKEIKKSFIECLLRLKKSFEFEMGEKGLDVKRVTIGQGYNDIKSVLDKYFNVIEFSDMLSNYSGYSDAGIQYDIKLKEKENKTTR